MLNTIKPKLKGERCECTTCGRMFVGARPFDRHRTGQYGLPAGHPDGRRCMTEAEMIHAARMELNATGLWRIRPNVPRH